MHRPPVQVRLQQSEAIVHFSPTALQPPETHVLGPPACDSQRPEQHSDEAAHAAPRA